MDDCTYSLWRRTGEGSFSCQVVRSRMHDNSKDQPAVSGGLSIRAVIRRWLLGYLFLLPSLSCYWGRWLIGWSGGVGDCGWSVCLASRFVAFAADSCRCEKDDGTTRKERAALRHDVPWARLRSARWLLPLQMLVQTISAAVIIISITVSATLHRHILLFLAISDILCLNQGELVLASTLWQK